MSITVAYEQSDPGDPGAWYARRDGEPFAANHALLSTDEAGAHRWAASLQVDRTPVVVNCRPHGRTDLDWLVELVALQREIDARHRAGRRAGVS